MCVAGCVGAMRPGVGGSDWDCWNCAAASRRGCPDGLAGHADADKNGTRRGDKADKKKRGNGGESPAQRIVGNVVQEE